MRLTQPMAAGCRLGLLSTYYFSRLHEPPAASPLTRIFLAPAAIWRDIRSQPGFLGLILTAALWNFSLNIAGPFFTVYMVQNLKATATLVGITSVATSVSTLVFQSKRDILRDEH